MKPKISELFQEQAPRYRQLQRQMKRRQEITESYNGSVQVINTIDEEEQNDVIMI